LKPSHGSWLENFPFTRVADLPEGEKTPPYIPGLLSAEQARQIYADGSFGGPYTVDDSIMEEVFAAALQDVLTMLDFD
jgi:creatinine amidohydrolase